MEHPFYQCLTCKTIFKSYDRYRKPKYCNLNCFGARDISPVTRVKMAQAKEGYTPWNKGKKIWDTHPHPRGTLGKKILNRKKISVEDRKKLRESHLGIRYPSFSKEKHWNWKNGITSESQVIRKSPEYKNWRRQVFERDKHTCCFCFRVGGYLQADHIEPFSISKEKRFNIDNGRTLCLQCHRKTDTYGGRMHKQYKLRS